MTRLTEDDRPSLLGDLAELLPTRGAKAEDETVTDLTQFLPLPAHVRALEPSVLVVTGGRGAGKTAMFRVLLESKGIEALYRFGRPSSLAPVERVRFVAGFDKTKKFPEAAVVSQALDNASLGKLRAFWTGLLVSSLLREEHCADSLTASLGELAAGFELPAALSRWLPVVETNLERFVLALDKLDDWLIEDERWVFVTYDRLDTVTVEYPGLRPFVRELLAFWLEQWRRRERILPKIFLRTDLFEEEFLAFPDGSKLKGNRLDLTWDPAWLYRLLFKRMANRSRRLRGFLERSCGLRFVEDVALGWMPQESEDAYRVAIETMVGRYMGSGPSKGDSYQWVVNHLQDANGMLVPRSILKLFSKAAEIQTEGAGGDRLLHPSSLQGALMDTSEERLRELFEEYPWMAQLKAVLRRQSVPMPREELERMLVRADLPEPQKGRDPKLIADDLIRLGVLRITADRRIHVPDIYLYGFGLKRKGGVKRPRRYGGHEAR